MGMGTLRTTLSSTAAQVILYGVLLAAGTFALGWLDLQRLTRAYSLDVFVTLIAVAFLVLGAWLGARLFRAAPKPAAFDGNPKALETLGISPRELAVLQELAAGRSNKEIAIKLAVSPNTIKTHTARLFEKLGAKRRTDAINRGRELGLIP
jgi:DNA-binding CsgD family transcriptional regulator